MALKTINADGRIAVTAAAEMFLAADTRRIRCVTDMAVDTFSQAVLLVTDAFVNRFVALVKDVLHMILAHICGRFHTALRLTEAALGLGNIGQQAFGHGCRYRAGSIARSRAMKRIFRISRTRRSVLVIAHGHVNVTGGADI